MKLKCRTIGLLGQLTLLVGFVPLCPGAVAGADEFCATEKPETILTCLEKAFGARDIEAFSKLLSSDYHFLATGADSTSWDREAEINATTQFLESEDALDINLVVSEGYEVHPGSEPDTWVLDKVTTVIKLTEREEPNPKLTTLRFENQRISVRRVPEPVVHYVIYDLVRPAMQVAPGRDDHTKDRK